jgi:hypothetical protein
MKYNVAFYPIHVAFLSLIGIMFETNYIPNLFKQFFRRFFHGMISQKILEIMTNWLDIQKKSGYHRQISRKFLDIILDRVNIRKVSAFYSTKGGDPESFRIINSYT